MPAKTTFVRSFATPMDYNITISNFDNSTEVAGVKLPSMNYNISLFFSADGKSSVHDLKTSFADESLTSGLELSDSVTLNDKTNATLPKDVCPSTQFICALVLPSYGASYSLASEDNAIKCVDVASMKNCDGKCSRL